jgi:hypothetical protein
VARPRSTSIGASPSRATLRRERFSVLQAIGERGEQSLSDRVRQVGRLPPRGPFRRLTSGSSGCFIIRRRIFDVKRSMASSAKSSVLIFTSSRSFKQIPTHTITIAANLAVDESRTLICVFVVEAYDGACDRRRRTLHGSTGAWKPVDRQRSIGRPRAHMQFRYAPRDAASL